MDRPNSHALLGIFWALDVLTDTSVGILVSDQDRKEVGCNGC